MEASIPSLGLRVHAVKGGNYMLRSERRRHYEPPTPETEPPKKPEKPSKPKKPKREHVKRAHAGFIYKFFTLLLGVVLWPVGLILLLRRYLRWKPFTKFLTACFTLAACVILYGFLLTVNTGNEAYTRFQDTVNMKLETVAAQLSDWSEVASDKLVEITDGADNLLRACADVAGVKAADIIDRGVDLAWSARAKIADWTGNTSLLQPTPTPEPTPTPAPTATPEPGATPAPIAVNAGTVLLPVYIPDATMDPASGSNVAEGRMTRYGLFPSVTPEPDISIDADIVRSYPVRTAAGAKVYCNFGSGHYYHTTPSCGSMKTAEPHTLKEAVEAGMQPCERCAPIAAEFLETPYIVWQDETGLSHTDYTCPAFSGQPQIMKIDDLDKDMLKLCDECDCDDYASAVLRGDTINVVPLEQFS